MYPAISRAISLSADTLPCQQFRGCLHRAQRISQLVRQAGGQLPQRGQPIGAAHLRFGFLQMAIGFGQFFRGGLRFPHFVAIGFGELVCQESDHG